MLHQLVTRRPGWRPLLCPARYLPIATPYSHRLAQLFDQLQLRPGDKQESEGPPAARSVKSAWH